MNSLQLVREVGRLAVLRQGVSGMMDATAERISLRLHQLDYENLAEGVAAVWEHGATHWTPPLYADQGGARQIYLDDRPCLAFGSSRRKLADRMTSEPVSEGK